MDLLDVGSAAIYLAPARAVRNLYIEAYIFSPTRGDVFLFGSGSALLAQGITLWKNCCDMYSGFFAVSKEIRLRDCQISVDAENAYGIARTITGLVELDGVSITLNWMHATVLGDRAIGAVFRLTHCRL